MKTRGTSWVKPAQLTCAVRCSTIFAELNRNNEDPMFETIESTSPTFLRLLISFSLSFMTVWLTYYVHFRRTQRHTTAAGYALMVPVTTTGMWIFDVGTVPDYTVILSWAAFFVEVVYQWFPAIRDRPAK